MAVGIAKTLGFDLINNFKRPYFATSVSEFWKRWHISLTRWLTQQIYIPLGGSHCSKIRTFCNIMITFLVSGIWHGANWTFIVWGGIHGVFQIIEKALGWNKKDSKGLVKVLRIVFTFAIVTVAWVIFRSPSIGDAVGMISRYFTTTGRLIADSAGQQLLYCFMGILLLFVYEVIKEYKPEFYSRVLRCDVVRWAIYLVIFCMIILIGVHDGSSFIYVSF